jgi:hypothetical protein
MSDSMINLIPDAHLLLASLRSVGYKVETAIADILDNCISAHANEIVVDFIWNDENSKILIADNGQGMIKDDLIAAMKIGSADPTVVRESDDLGRFGMGMKTAAFSLGKKLAVISKKNNEISNACWDLDYIEMKQDGMWSLKVSDNNSDEIVEYEKYLENYESGTLIAIENLDRLVSADLLKKSKTSFYITVEKVKKHIGMIFHRFIEEDDLIIKFGNYEVIEAWNPFILNNSATQELGEEEYYEGDNAIYIQPYVLPHKTKFLSLEEYENAQGPRGWVAQQGVYVYRNRRLLVYGTWFDYLKKEPAFNLARIKLDITSASDYDWKIDIKKSVATPPLYIRDMLERAISVCTLASSKVYNSRGAYSKTPGSQQLGYVWEQRKNRLGAYAFYINKKHPLLNKVTQKLDEDGKGNLKAYLALIENYAPFMQSGMTSYLNDGVNNENEDTPEKLADIKEAKGYIRKFFENGFCKEEIETIILGMPNYRYIEKELKEIFEEEQYD